MDYFYMYYVNILIMDLFMDYLQKSNKFIINITLSI